MNCINQRSRDAAPAVPVHVIMGALGVGKTSAIARLLAAKSPDEYWVVVLNEFTDAGIDALTIAASARGAYDVTVIPGGCLCCTGELTFRRRMHQQLRERRPDRILIEPSGIGHPGGLVEELRAMERSGTIELKSIMTLVDAWRLGSFREPGIERDQIEAADVLVLTKADLCDEQTKQRFADEANALFPPKRWIGQCTGADLPSAALDPPPAILTLRTPQRPQLHIEARAHALDHAHDIDETERTVELGEHTAIARACRLLDRRACTWIAPPEAMFNRVAIELFLDAQRLAGVERLKAALRTGVESWTLINVTIAGVSLQPTGWRRDNRIEIQLKPGVTADWSRWDAWWRERLA
jgi:G3E family GTPase